MEELKAILLIIVNLLGLGGALNYPQESIVSYSAWVASWEEGRAFKSFQNSENYLSEILPLWYSLNESASLQPIKSFNWDTKTPVVASITNNFDPIRVNLLVRDSKKTEEFTNSLLSEAKKHNFSGWDLDWEQIYYEDSLKYSDFVNNLARKLQDNKLTLSITLHAKAGDSSDWKGSVGHDYDSLGKSKADKIRVMAYDFHSTGTPAGAITPLDWLEKVIKYAQAYIPPEKLVIALPSYGYDWSSGSAKPINYEDVEALPLKRDSQSAELTLDSIWVQDTESIAKKVEVAKRLGINKITFWKLGSSALDTFLLSQPPLKE